MHLVDSIACLEGDNDVNKLQVSVASLLVLLCYKKSRRRQRHLGRERAAFALVLLLDLLKGYPLPPYGL